MNTLTFNREEPLPRPNIPHPGTLEPKPLRKRCPERT